ncbi:MAG: hypothetical protein IKC11_01085 [Clostridia bacterium]|nr:hypothetical protein [Clostridia bacterium]
MELFEKDELFDKVWEYVQEKGYASLADIQRNFTIGYARTARIVNQLEEVGYIYYDEKGNRKLNLNAQKELNTQKEEFKEIELEGFENFSAPIRVFLQALRFGILEGKTSTVDIQRYCTVGYAMAVKIIDKMLELGFIEPKEKEKTKYKVVLSAEEYNKRFGKIDDIR